MISDCCVLLNKVTFFFVFVSNACYTLIWNSVLSHVSLLLISWHWDFTYFLQPLVSGAALGLEGQVNIFLIKDIVLFNLTLYFNSLIDFSNSWLFIITMEVHAIGASFQVHHLWQPARDAQTVVFLGLVGDSVSALHGHNIYFAADKYELEYFLSTFFKFIHKLVCFYDVDFNLNRKLNHE